MPPLTCSIEDAKWFFALTPVVAPLEHKVSVTFLEDDEASKVFQYDPELNVVTIKPTYQELILAGKFCFEKDFTLNFDLESDILGEGKQSFDFSVEADRKDPNITFF